MTGTNPHSEHKADEQDWLDDLIEDAIEFGHRDYSGAVRSDAERQSDYQDILDTKAQILAHYVPKPIVTPDTSDEELREQITAVKDRLGGRIETHRKVAKFSGWTNSELQQVIIEDGWIFEDEMIALIHQYVTKKLIEEWKRACIDNWQCPIPEQYALDRIAELEKQLEGGK